MSIQKRKIAIVGVGTVGATVAYNVITAGVCDELLLVNRTMDRAVGEVEDLRHSIEYINRNTHIYAGTYADCKDMDIIVLTVSARPKPGSTRLQLMEANVEIMRETVGAIKESGFDGHIIVISNPVDIMSYLVYKFSGLPKNRIIGTGTTLDSARLKVILSDLVQVDARSIHAFCMGEHGNSQMIPWSLVNIGGKDFAHYVKDNEAQVGKIDYEDLLRQTREAGNEVFRVKGGTQYGISSATVGIIKAIVFDENRVMPVSTLLEGEYGEEDIFCSVPVIINNTGVKGVGEMHLTEEETRQFKESVAVLRSHMEKLPPI